MPEFDPAAAGARLQAAITEAYGKPGRVRNEHQLSEVSHVYRTMFESWRKGTPPKPEKLQAVADALGVPAEHLWLRSLGYDPPEPGLSRIADEIKELRTAISSAGGGPQQVQDALAAIDAARADQPGEPEANPPSEPVATSRRRRPGA